MVGLGKRALSQDRNYDVNIVQRVLQQDVKKTTLKRLVRTTDGADIFVAV
jgi:hypothetical protein